MCHYYQGSDYVPLEAHFLVLNLFSRSLEEAWRDNAAQKGQMEVQRAETEQQLAEWQQQATSLMAQIDGAQTLVLGLRGEVTALQGERAALQAEAMAMKEQVEPLQLEAQRAKEESASLAEQRDKIAVRLRVVESAGGADVDVDALCNAEYEKEVLRAQVPALVHAHQQPAPAPSHAHCSVLPCAVPTPVTEGGLREAYKECPDSRSTIGTSVCRCTGDEVGRAYPGSGQCRAALQAAGGRDRGTADQHGQGRGAAPRHAQRALRAEGQHPRVLSRAPHACTRRGGPSPTPPLSTTTSY